MIVFLTYITQIFHSTTVERGNAVVGREEKNFCMLPEVIPEINSERADPSPSFQGYCLGTKNVTYKKNSLIADGILAPNNPMTHTHHIRSTLEKGDENLLKFKVFSIRC